jgi:DinB superfamily
MFERERKVCPFVLGTLEKLMEDVSDEELSRQPLPGMNPPRWIVAHLAVVADACLQLLGRQPVLPAEWHQSFSPGSKHGGEGGPQPSKAELLSAVRSAHERLFAAIDEADESLLERPHGLTFASLDRAFPTRADLLANLMTAHAALHTGQLSAWRRATGRPALF